MPIMRPAPSFPCRLWLIGVFTFAAAIQIALASPPASPPPPAPSPAGGAPSASAAATHPAASQPATFGLPVSTAINPPKMITFKSATFDIKALLITPRIPASTSLDKAPAVILVHDIFGMTPFIKQQAEIFARQGYTVLVPNLYSRLDNTDQALDAKAAAAAYDQTPDQQATTDLSAAIDYLEGPPVDNQPEQRAIGVVGYDMGGIYAMMIAGIDLRVTCAVNYYGRILYAATSQSRPTSPVESLFNLHAPLLSFYGAIDPQVPDNQIRALQSRLSHNLGKTYYETIRYPGVGHGFVDPDRPGYNKQAAEKSAAKARDFLARYLRAKPAPTE